MVQFIFKFIDYATDN